MSDDPTEALQAVAASIGSAPPDSPLQIDGQLHRCHDRLNDRPGQKNAFYVMHHNPDGTVGGIFGSNKTGQRATFCTGLTRTYTPAEQAEYARQRAAAQAKAEAERLEAQKQAAAKAAQLWDRSRPARPAHPYLVRKAVPPYRARQIGPALVFDYRDQHGIITTLQFIQEDGSKRFLSGGRVAACSHRFGPKVNRVLILAEGFATAATIHEATGHPVAVCGFAGNLQPVALAARAAFPDAVLVVAGDSDPVGRQKAIEAAEAVRGRVVFPDFGGLGVVHGC
ncbi:MAG: toprim domain-containing protein [Trichlorobacter sp.]|uniref:toprim domain-containing protein n=1 Tax=Trichlorobacter sp. TaxID=2911007 RepID=UPI0025681F3A|nr:toprim domain-containing protein [Trichlorobacter sp.]MDK9716832.1 toprim domain-containing protein [Trichlorobacter sp.]